MGLPNADVMIGGKAVTLSLPIAGLEEVAKVNPYPEELWNAFRLRQYRLDELMAVLRAGLKWGGSDMTAEDVVDRVGLRQAAEFAAAVMSAAVRDDDEKKAEAAPEDASDS